MKIKRASSGNATSRTREATSSDDDLLEEQGVSHSSAQSFYNSMSSVLPSPEKLLRYISQLPQGFEYYYTASPEEPGSLSLFGIAEALFGEIIERLLKRAGLYRVNSAGSAAWKLFTDLEKPLWKRITELPPLLNSLNITNGWLALIATAIPIMQEILKTLEPTPRREKAPELGPAFDRLGLVLLGGDAPAEAHEHPIDSVEDDRTASDLQAPGIFKQSLTAATGLLRMLVVGERWEDGSTRGGLSRLASNELLGAMLPPGAVTTIQLFDALGYVVRHCQAEFASKPNLQPNEAAWVLVQALLASPLRDMASEQLVKEFGFTLDDIAALTTLDNPHPAPTADATSNQPSVKTGLLKKTVNTLHVIGAQEQHEKLSATAQYRWSKQLATLGNVSKVLNQLEAYPASDSVSNKLGWGLSTLTHPEFLSLLEKVLPEQISDILVVPFRMARDQYDPPDTGEGWDDKLQGRVNSLQNPRYERFLKTYLPGQAMAVRRWALNAAQFGLDTVHEYKQSAPNAGFIKQAMHLGISALSAGLGSLAAGLKPMAMALVMWWQSPEGLDFVSAFRWVKEKIAHFGLRFFFPTLPLSATKALLDVTQKSLSILWSFLTKGATEGFTQLAFELGTALKKFPGLPPALKDTADLLIVVPAVWQVDEMSGSSNAGNLMRIRNVIERLLHSEDPRVKATIEGLETKIVDYTMMTLGLPKTGEPGPLTNAAIAADQAGPVLADARAMAPLASSSTQVQAFDWTAWTPSAIHTYQAAGVVGAASFLYSMAMLWRYKSALVDTARGAKAWAYDLMKPKPPESIPMRVLPTEEGTQLLADDREAYSLNENENIEETHQPPSSMKWFAAWAGAAAVSASGSIYSFLEARRLAHLEELIPIAAEFDTPLPNDPERTYADEIFERLLEDEEDQPDLFDDEFKLEEAINKIFDESYQRGQTRDRRDTDNLQIEKPAPRIAARDSTEALIAPNPSSVPREVAIEAIKQQSKNKRQVRQILLKQARLFESRMFRIPPELLAPYIFGYQNTRNVLARYGHTKDVDLKSPVTAKFIRAQGNWEYLGDVGPAWALAAIAPSISWLTSVSAIEHTWKQDRAARQETQEVLLEDITFGNLEKKIGYGSTDVELSSNDYSRDALHNLYDNDLPKQYSEALYKFFNENREKLKTAFKMNLEKALVKCLPSSLGDSQTAYDPLENLKSNKAHLYPVNFRASEVYGSDIELGGVVNYRDPQANIDRIIFTDTGEYIDQGAPRELAERFEIEMSKIGALRNDPYSIMYLHEALPSFSENELNKAINAKTGLQPKYDPQLIKGLSAVLAQQRADSSAPKPVVSPAQALYLYPDWVKVQATPINMDEYTDRVLQHTLDTLDETMDSISTSKSELQTYRWLVKIEQLITALVTLVAIGSAVIGIGAAGLGVAALSSGIMTAAGAALTAAGTTAANASLALAVVASGTAMLTSIGAESTRIAIADTREQRVDATRRLLATLFVETVGFLMGVKLGDAGGLIPKRWLAKEISSLGAATAAAAFTGAGVTYGGDVVGAVTEWLHTMNITDIQLDRYYGRGKYADHEDLDNSPRTEAVQPPTLDQSEEMKRAHALGKLKRLEAEEIRQKQRENARVMLADREKQEELRRQEAETLKVWLAPAIASNSRDRQEQFNTIDKQRIFIFGQIEMAKNRLENNRDYVERDLEEIHELNEKLRHSELPAGKSTDAARLALLTTPYMAAYREFLVAEMDKLYLIISQDTEKHNSMVDFLRENQAYEDTETLHSHREETSSADMQDNVKAEVVRHEQHQAWRQEQEDESEVVNQALIDKQNAFIHQRYEHYKNFIGAENPLAPPDAKRAWHRQNNVYLDSEIKRNEEILDIDKARNRQPNEKAQAELIALKRLKSENLSAIDLIDRDQQSSSAS